MKSFSILLASLFVFTGIARCDDHVEETEIKIPSQYLVTLSEYHLAKPVPVEATEVEILEMLRQSKQEPVETVRLTAFADTDCMMNLSKQVNLVTGTTTRGPVVSKQTETYQVGTILRVRIVAKGEGVIAEIDYSTSRISSDEVDFPEVQSNSVEATSYFNLGKQRLLSSSSAENAPFLVVSIQEAG